MLNIFEKTKKIEYEVRPSIADEKFASAVKLLESGFALKRSMKEEKCIDAKGNPIPWYTYPAIEYIRQLDFSDKRIFEYGCGNSSLFWSDIAKEVVSVDEDKIWYESQLKTKRDNMRLQFQDSGPNYYDSILKEVESFDVIVIDGHYNRDKCAENAIKKINTDGLIILDNSDRVQDMKEYSDAVKILKDADMIQVDFCGFGPINNYTWITSFFFTRQFNFKSKSHPLQPLKSIGNV